ncbi:MAG: phosphoribosylformylglycinamidine synthase subunit PurQ [Rickettsiales bacterium]|jgi:phosphoribosylformylglycinamidine synthase subunit PurQ / glutaminase|nr:phosphoribosylformylglycinamidine synthase subunit PurQ [Rickettsiales bacterium]
MKAGVIVFPGSNCDRDMQMALKTICSDVQYIWHKDSTIPSDIDIIALPGGFSYGDYLRCGAIAASSNILSEIKKCADQGKYILGVCNGFQILTEAGLLPGTLMRNKNLKFISKVVELETISTNSQFTNKAGSKLMLPVAHHDGNYFCDKQTLESLQDNDQIAFKYSENINGSIENIAGIFNKNKNILGMMPHPERAIDNKTSGTDGLGIFRSLLA